MPVKKLFRFLLAASFLTLLIFNSICLASPPASANAKLCPKAFPESIEAETWTYLRLRSLLVSTQGRTVESICGAVCVVNAVQATAVLSGRLPIPYPEQAFTFVHQKFGVSLLASQTAEAFGALLKRYYPDLEVTIRTNLVPGARDRSERDTNRLTKLAASDLKPSARRLVILYSAHFKPTNELAFQHAMIWAYENADKISIVEPGSPYLDIQVAEFAKAQLNDVPVPLFQYTNIDFPTAPRFAPFGFLTIDLPEEPTIPTP